MRFNVIKVWAPYALAAFLALGCVAGRPQRAMVEPQGSFAVMDQNKDNKISKDEYLQHWSDKKKGEENFKKLDVDGDGFLTDADRKALMNKLDADKNGFITLPEYLAKGEKSKEREDEFRKMDLNRDGVISSEEFQARWPSITVFSW